MNESCHANECVQLVVMQHTAPHCNTLHHTATYCNILQHTATQCRTLQPTATHCNTLQHAATDYTTSNFVSCEAVSSFRTAHTATRCNTLQRTATRCNTRQHAATHCNTLHQTIQHQRSCLARPCCPSPSGVTCPIESCDMTHPFARHDPFISTSGPIHEYDSTR